MPATTQERGTWSRGQVAGALLAGALLRTFFVLHPARFAGDTLVYGDLAHNMLAHHMYGLTESHVRSTLIRLPGYPLFLALCFVLFGTGNYLAVIRVQMAVDLVSCVLLGLLGRRLFGPKVGLAVLWLAACCPFTANYAAAALTETLSIFCVVLVFWAVTEWVTAVRQAQRATGLAALAGLGLAGAALLRPDGILLAAATLPSMLWVVLRGGDPKGNRSTRAGRLTGPLLAALILCSALGLWAGRNWHRFHVFQPLAPKYANDPDEVPPLGFARWYRTWAVGFNSTVDVYWTYDGSPLRWGDLPPRAFDNPAQQRETAALYARYNDLNAATPDLDAAFGALAAQRIRAHPVRYYVLLPLAKLGDMWLRPRTELMKLPIDWWRVRAHPGRSMLEIAYAGLNVVLLGMGAAGWARWRHARWAGYAPIAGMAAGLVLLRCAMLLTIDNSEPRYTLECYPVVLLLAGLACAGARFGSVRSCSDEPKSD